MRPQNLINMPPPVPDPGPPTPDMLRRQTREERMQRIQGLIDNFTYSLGSGLSASANAGGGPRNRTMAGVGAALQAPAALQRAQQEFALKKQQEQADAEARRQQLANSAAQLAETQRHNLATEAPDPVAPVKPSLFNTLRGTMNEADLGAGIIPGTEPLVPEKPKPNRTNYSPDTVLYKGKATDVLRDLDPDSETAGRVFKMTSSGLQDITDEVSHYEKPSTTIIQPQQAYGALSATLKEGVDAVAEKVASGEISYANGLSALGGVRGGLGTALTQALSSKRVLPVAVRTASNDIERAKNLLVPVYQLVDEINATSDLGEKARKSLQIDNYVRSIGTQFARARGERGVVTDEDVNRVLGLVPGWKSANFAPEFARDNLKLIENAFDRDQQALLGLYFTKVPIGKPGGPEVVPGGAVPDYIEGPQGFPILNPAKQR